MGKYLIKQTKTGIKFDLKAGNGEVIATSEVYTTEKACRAGIASVQKNAPVAGIENQTEEGFAKVSIRNLRFTMIKQANSVSVSKQPTDRLLRSARATRHSAAA